MRFIRNNPVAVLLIAYMAYQSFDNSQGMSLMDWVMAKVIILPAILVGLSFHEFAHAFAADRLGDKTPRLQGRVTVNPIAHVDFFGFIALIFIGFGWGKPVEVNPRNFKHIRRDSILVDLAGVTVNFVLAIVFAGLLRLLTILQPEFMSSNMGGIVIDILFAVISINIVLMIFNLLPIPPLDGFGILTEVFNLREKEWYYQIYDKGFLILLVLIVFNVTGKVLVPAVQFVTGIVMNLFF
ncbi:MAG: site-2 protease family protein [Eubacteriales bacterium]|nr:site-2 protease family protein [Eubacteriales bacterium]